MLMLIIVPVVVVLSRPVPSSVLRALCQGAKGRPPVSGAQLPRPADGKARRRLPGLADYLPHRWTRAHRHRGGSPTPQAVAWLDAAQVPGIETGHEISGVPEARRQFPRLSGPGGQRLNRCRGMRDVVWVNDQSLVARHFSEQGEEDVSQTRKGTLLRKEQSRTGGSFSAEGASSTAPKTTEARPTGRHHLLFRAPGLSSRDDRSSRNLVRAATRLAGIVGLATGLVVSIGIAAPNIAVAQASQTSGSVASARTSPSAGERLLAGPLRRGGTRLREGDRAAAGVDGGEAHSGHRLHAR